MNATASSRRARITTAVVGSGVAVVLAVTAFGAVRAATPGAAGEASPTPAASAAPTPGATVSTPIRSDAPIRTDLTAEVRSAKAVTVKTDAPGEIGGPGVRFEIRVTNTTDAPVSLADTVVNAAAGEDGDPAYGIDSASTPFPATLAAGATATGVYVFTIPVADRDDVVVTLDTSAANPVVAFTGAVPR